MSRCAQARIFKYNPSRNEISKERESVTLSLETRKDFKIVYRARLLPVPKVKKKINPNLRYPKRRPNQTSTHIGERGEKIFCCCFTMHLRAHCKHVFVTLRGGIELNTPRRCSRAITTAPLSTYNGPFYYTFCVYIKSLESTTLFQSCIESRECATPRRVRSARTRFPRY